MADVGDLLPVFVYGLLQPDCAGFLELKLARRVAVLGPDRIRGTLYDLGEYPGVAPGTEVIEGHLLRLADTALLAELDAYELFDAADPARSEYRRERIRTLGGVIAWVYFYNGDVTDRPVISCGNWLRRGA